MPTSRKRTKRRRKLRFPVVILGICLIAALITGLVFGLRGCSKDASSSPEESGTAASSEAVQASSSGSDYSGLYLHKVNVNADTPLYTKTENGFVPCGTARAGAILDLSDSQEGDFINLNDSAFWIEGSAVSISERWYRNETHLVPYAEELITNDTYTIEDERGNAIASISESDRYPVYVKPGDDPRYGIRLMNAVYYIPQGDVSSTETITADTPALAQELPVLMYHFFYSTDDGGSRVDGNYVEVNELDEQLAYIHDNGFTACTMREVQYWMEGRAQLPYHSLVITIDDADPSVHQYAMPVFVKYGINACNFVICGWQPAEMSYDLWEMRENGMELQSHGFLTHTGGCSGMGHGGLLMCMDHDAGVEDTKRSFDYVDGGFVYCYPFGDINDNAESIVRDGGAKLAFTTEGGRITPNMDPLALPRVRVTGGNGLNAFAASIG